MTERDHAPARGLNNKRNQVMQQSLQTARPRLTGKLSLYLGALGIFGSVGLLGACSAGGADRDEADAVTSSTDLAPQPGAADDESGAVSPTAARPADAEGVRDSLASGSPLSIERARPSRAEREAAFFRSLNATLSEAEQQTLAAAFSRANIPTDKIRFSGRMISYGGDGYQYADDVLAAIAGDLTVEKGKVLSQAITLPGVSGGPASAPDLYARQVDDHTEFFRPDLRFSYMLVVDDDAPEFVITLLAAAVGQIVNAGDGDCLFPKSTFIPIRQSAFRAIDSRSSALDYVIDIVYGDSNTACGTDSANVLACAVFPRIEQHITSTIPALVSGPLMRFGTRLGIVDTAITGDSADNRGVILHELLHAMGIAHPEDDEIDTGLGGLTTQKITVHGTLDGTGFPSVMHSARSNPNWANTLQPDDQKVLLTLYSNYEDGLACGYFNGFRTPPFRL
jgi:hypothetical protein